MMMVEASGIHIAPLARDDAAGFARVHALCAAVIERSEQKTAAELRATFERDDYVFLAARRTGDLLGFASVFLPEGQDFWLLEYLAVAEAAQGEGCGAALFAAAVAHAGPGRIGLLEVDALPPPAADAMLRGKVGRRLAFYGRLGCRQIAGVDYLLPLQTYGAPPPMILLAHAPPSAESVKRHALLDWLRTIYVQVYAQDPGDSRIARMADKLPAELELLPL